MAGDPSEDPPENENDAAPPEDQQSGPRVSRIRVGGEELFVLSVPLPEIRYPEGATPAEREIIDLVLQGLSVKDIAGARGSSPRTVTTQLGVIFQKAGVNSQAELIAAMTRGEPED